MTGTFKANNPYNTFLLLVYGLLLKLPMFLHPVIPVVQKSDGFLFRGLLTQLSHVGSIAPVIYSLISFAILYLQAIMLNKLVSDQRLMQKPNYLTGMAFLLITSLFKEWNGLSAPLIVSMLLVWVWGNMNELYNSKNAKATLFNIGMGIAVATFIYFPSVAFVLLFVVGLLVTRPFKLSEWLIALLGILTPYYFLFTYLFLMDKLFGYRFPVFNSGLPKLTEPKLVMVAICVLLVSACIGLFFIQQNFRRQLIQARKSWNLVFLYFLVALSMPFFNNMAGLQYWILCAVPLSAFLASTFLYPTKNWFPVLLHWVLVAFVLAFGYFVK